MKSSQSIFQEFRKVIRQSHTVYFYGSAVWIIGILLLLGACKKEYAVDGGTSEERVNMSTYDYLSSKPVFSSLVHLIDRAGLKDAVNGESTFFATTNYGVDEYLKAMKNLRSVELGDENITYTLDSIPLWRLDSLKMYIFPQKLNRDQLNTKGAFYQSSYGAMTNIRLKLGLSRSYSYGNYVDYVDYITYTKVIDQDDADVLDASTIPAGQIDKTVFVQSSGIVTNNGIVHALDGYHRLFFNENSVN